ncbi:MAG TPA: hypothetical protein VM848_12925 [Acidimicrobiia bacterium]|nr:hypothetical protein [Acidimicrobiia bacterium]
MGLLIGFVYVLRIMIPSDMDPTIMLAFGKDSPAQSAYARTLVGEVSVRDSYGHDGQSFFLQAIDPWFLDPELHAIYIDRPVYRGQRMGYPTIASGFGLFPTNLIVWTLPLVNVLALGVGSLAASRLAQVLGGSTWLGLAFCLNPGVLSEVDISGGGALALAFGVWGVLAAEQGRIWPTAVTLMGAALSRETMLAFVGVVAWMLWRRGTKGWWVVVGVPTAASVAWGVYVRLQLSQFPSTGPGVVASYPFAGPVEAWGFWLDEPLNLLMIFAFLAICAAFTVRVLRSRQVLAWAAFPCLLIASLLSISVWRFPYDIARVFAPIFLAYPFLAFVAEPHQMERVRPAVGPGAGAVG